jgi:Fe-S-cluster-containing dehydrogenase component
VARDLQAHRGASLVIAGEHQPRRVHDIVRAINDALGNTGTTVAYVTPPPPAGVRSLRELNDAMKAGHVEALFIAGANPVYDAPIDLGFPDNLQKVPLRIHLGPYQDETAAVSHWHIPAAHFLESWGDARAYDGTMSIIQPLIAPLYEGRTAHELLASLTDAPDRSPYQIVRQFWATQRPAGGFEEFWERSVHDGFVSNAVTAATPTGAAAKPATTPAQVSPPAQAPASAPPQAPAQSGHLEIVFRPDPSVWDGRFANNGWLQELAKPVSKITWGNAAYISPATAERLKLEHSDMVELEYRGRKVRAPLWVTPGQAADSVTVFLGYGRKRSGRASNDLGYSAYALRTWDHPHFDNGLEVRRLGDKHAFNSTQTHHSMEGRDIVRSATNAEFLKNHRVMQNEEKEKDQYDLSIYPSWKYEGYKWGMAIDMNACIGCSACITACQSENNIPVVGGDQVRRGREMQWLRVDRYHEGKLDNPTVFFQPVPCMHCEQAPCEPVCPVAATVHSAEGLNQMIYNRCVGTRYCSNNCPYKVRRFNFYLYADWETPTLAAVRNPDVTTRSRGVMEKCTYCVQRIEQAKIDAEKENRRVRDGEVVTACQGACPTDAIIFGDINDKNSRVFKLKQSPLNYSLLADLGTQPRTTYLGKLRNPNPELERES